MHHRKNTQQNTTKVPNKMPQKFPTKCHKSTQRNATKAPNKTLQRTQALMGTTRPAGKCNVHTLNIDSQTAPITRLSVSFCLNSRETRRPVALGA